MGKFTNKIGLLFLSVVYVVATLGLSVHTCLCEHQSSLVFPWEGIVCDHAAAHSHNTPSSCGGDCCSCENEVSHVSSARLSHSEQECCQTEVFVVDDSFVKTSADKFDCPVKILQNLYLPAQFPNTDLVAKAGSTLSTLDLKIERPPLERDIVVEVAQYRL